MDVQKDILQDKSSWQGIVHTSSLPWEPHPHVGTREPLFLIISRRAEGPGWGDIEMPPVRPSICPSIKT